MTNTELKIWLKLGLTTARQLAKQINQLRKDTKSC